MSKKQKPTSTKTALETQLTDALKSYVKNTALESQVREKIQAKLTTKIAKNWKQYLQLFMQDQTAMLAFLYRDIKETVNDELHEAGVPLTIDKIAVIAGALLGAYAGYNTGTMAGSVVESVVPSEYQGIAKTTLTLVTTAAGAISGAMATSALLEQWNKSQDFLLKKGHMLLRGETNKPEHAKAAAIPKATPSFMNRKNQKLITTLSRDPKFKELHALEENDIYSLFAGKEAARPDETKASIFVVAGYPKQVNRTKTTEENSNLNKLIDINILCRTMMLQTQALGATSQEEAEAQLALLQLMYNWSALGIDLVRKETTDTDQLIESILKQIHLYHDQAFSNIKTSFKGEVSSTEKAIFDQIRLAAFSQFSATKAAIETETENQWKKFTALTSAGQSGHLVSSNIDSTIEIIESEKTATHPLVEIGRSTTKTLIKKVPGIIDENSETIAENIAKTVKSTAKAKAKETLEKIGLSLMGREVQIAANALIDKATERLGELTQDLATEALSQEALKKLTKEIFIKTTDSSTRSGATDNYLRETGIIPPGLLAKHAVITFSPVYELNEDGSATFTNLGEAYNTLESQFSISRKEDYTARLLLRQAWQTASMQNGTASDEQKTTQLKADKKKVSDFIKLYKGSNLSQNSEKDFNAWYQGKETEIREKTQAAVIARETKATADQYLNTPNPPNTQNKMENNATKKLKAAIEEKLRQQLISEQSIADLKSDESSSFHKLYQDKKAQLIRSLEILEEPTGDTQEPSLTTKLDQDFDTYFLIHSASDDKIDFILEGNETVKNELLNRMALLILHHEVKMLVPAVEAEAEAVEAAGAAAEPTEVDTAETATEMVYFQTETLKATEASTITSTLIKKPDTNLTHSHIRENLNQARTNFLSQLEKAIASSPMLITLLEKIPHLKYIAADLYLKNTITGITSTSRPKDLLVEAYSQLSETETPAAEMQEAHDNKISLQDILFNGFMETVFVEHSEAQVSEEATDGANSPRASGTGDKMLTTKKKINFQSNLLTLYLKATTETATNHMTPAQLGSFLGKETSLKGAARTLLSNPHVFKKMSAEPGVFTTWFEKPIRAFFDILKEKLSSTQEQARRLPTEAERIVTEVGKALTDAAYAAKQKVTDTVGAAAETVSSGVSDLKNELREAAFGPQPAADNDRVNSASEDQENAARTHTEACKTTLNEHLDNAFNSSTTDHTLLADKLSVVADRIDFTSFFSAKEKTKKAAKKAFLKSTSKNLTTDSANFLQNVESLLKVACHHVRKHNHLKSTNTLKAISNIIARGLQDTSEDGKLKLSCQHFIQSLVLLMLKNGAIYNPGQNAPDDNTKLTLLSSHEGASTKKQDETRIKGAGFKSSARRELLALQGILFRNLVGTPTNVTNQAANGAAPVADGAATDRPKTLVNALQDSDSLIDNAYVGLDQKKIILMVQLAICVKREAYQSSNTTTHKLSSNFLENGQVSYDLTRNITAKATDEPAALPPAAT